jgi:hypothetical protein
MIRQRVNAGLSAIKAKIRRDGHFTAKAGIVRRRLGRPGAEPKQISRARQELAKGLGIGKVARMTGLSSMISSGHWLGRDIAEIRRRLQRRTTGAAERRAWTVGKCERD